MTINGEEFRWPSDIWTWIQISGVICGMVGFLIMVGVTIGPLKDVAARVTVLEAKVRDSSYDIKDLQGHRSAIDERMNGSEADRRELHTKLTSVEQKANTDVSKLEFLEWARALERQNKNLYAPSIKQHGE
jgi:hypothetical protein